MGGTYLYRAALLQAAPGKLLEVVDFYKAGWPGVKGTGDEPPFRVFRIAVAVVQRRDTRAVIRHPPFRPRARGQPPCIQHVFILQRRGDGCGVVRNRIIHSEQRRLGKQQPRFKVFKSDRGRLMIRLIHKTSHGNNSGKSRYV
jgi:hypothetical protein